MTRILSQAALAVAAAATAATAAAAPAPQQTLWTQSGELRYERYGQSVAWLDDQDGDGVRDFAAGAPSWDPPFVPRYGVVRICSGVDGSLLRELRDDERRSFGWKVANAGDLDGDGLNDVLVGAPFDGDGFAFACSSGGGAPLLDLTGSASASPLARYGDGLVSLGDLDGDAVPDFAIGAPDHVAGGNRVGLIELRSGATGALLFARTGGGDSNFGDDLQLDAAGDLDGDAIGDLLAVQMVAAPAGSPNCDVDVWSGATFNSVLHQSITLPATFGASFHHACARVAGDVDGDGTVDFVVSMDQRLPGPSARAILVSGASGATIRTIVGSSSASGERCGGVGDVDGDGLAEVAVTKGTVKYGMGDLQLFKGSDGSLLRTILEDHYASHAFATSFDATVDADGDAIHDLLVGSPPFYDPASGWLGGPGRVQRRSLLDGSTAFAQDGTNFELYLTGQAVIVDDVDGDGLLDVVARASSKPTTLAWLSLRSGADGHELAASPPPFGNLAGAMVALPDVDGDGFVDVAVAPNDGTAGRVEVWSGATLQLLKTLTLPIGVASGLLTLSAAVQPATGHVELCVGAPFAIDPSNGVTVGCATHFDVNSGALLWQKLGNPAYPYEGFGSGSAFVGDLNGDGRGDWAISAPGNGKNGADCGCVRLVSGLDGSLVTTLFGIGAGQRFGTLVAALPDQGGDGIGELLVTSPSTFFSKIELLDSAAWTTVATAWGGANYPKTLVSPLPDLNGDGVADFAVGATDSQRRYELRSGRDATLLHRQLFGAGRYEGLGWRAAGPPPGQSGVRRKGGGPVVVAWDPMRSDLGTYTGAIELVELDDLYLEIDPPSAPAGATVEVFVRGGPAAAAAALALEAINGVPLFVMLAVDVFDVNGELALDAVIPPGLSGEEWTLRGWAIGWNGKLVVSQSARFTFE